jgi:hypothetical protein
MEYPESMPRLGHRLVFVAMLALWGGSANAQDQPNPAAGQQNNFFSGVIVASSATDITVDRKGLGKDTAATRTFMIDGNTKIEGTLKSKAHVTVRFVAEESGTRAIHIIVR